MSNTGTQHAPIHTPSSFPAIDLPTRVKMWVTIGSFIFAMVCGTIGATLWLASELSAIHASVDALRYEIRTSTPTLADYQGLERRVRRIEVRIGAD